MGTISAIEAVAEGLARHLNRAFELTGPAIPSFKFQPAGAKDFHALKDESATGAIYLYRVTHNEFMRNLAPVSPARPVTVDLHFLFCLWLDTASREHTVLGWLLRELARYPVLDRGMTDSSGGFAIVDRMQFIPSELSLDDMSKLWQLLGLPYRASLTYVVRNVQIGPEAAVDSAPVVATRFEHRDEVEAGA